MGEVALQSSSKMRNRNGHNVWKLASRLKELQFVHKPNLLPQFSCALFLEADPMSKTQDCVELPDIAREQVQRILDCAWPSNTYSWYRTKSMGAEFHSADSLLGRNSTNTGQVGSLICSVSEIIEKQKTTTTLHFILMKLEKKNSSRAKYLLMLIFRSRQQQNVSDEMFPCSFSSS